MDSTQIPPIMNQLIALGEDRDEMAYWHSIFNNLPADKQVLLYENLKQELEALSA